MAARAAGMRIVIAVVTIALALVGETTAQSDNVVMDAGATGKSDRGTCILKGSPCYLKRLACPDECPSRRAEEPRKSACFMDCTKTCKASCTRRKTNCFGYGAVCYDPRFIGGDGVMFYFHGRKDHNYCVVSDRNLHINAHFIGKRPLGRPREYTWVESLGFVFESHNFSVGAKKVATWDDEVDQLVLNYDGRDIQIIPQEGALWIAPSGDVVVERTAHTNNILVMIDQMLEVILEVVPIKDYESRLHNYEITEEDCFAHLQMQFTFYSLSSSVNGILGQTYQRGFETPVKQNVPIPTMGGEETYLSSSLFATDCEVSQFSSNSAVEPTSSVLDAEAESREVYTVKCQSAGDDGGMRCRR